MTSTTKILEAKQRLQKEKLSDMKKFNDVSSENSRLLMENMGLTQANQVLKQNNSKLEQQNLLKENEIQNLEKSKKELNKQLENLIKTLETFERKKTEENHLKQQLEKEIYQNKLNCDKLLDFSIQLKEKSEENQRLLMLNSELDSQLQSEKTFWEQQDEINQEKITKLLNELEEKTEENKRIYEEINENSQVLKKFNAIEMQVSELGIENQNIISQLDSKNQSFKILLQESQVVAKDLEILKEKTKFLENEKFDLKNMLEISEKMNKMLKEEIEYLINLKEENETLKNILRQQKGETTTQSSPNTKTPDKEPSISPSISNENISSLPAFISVDEKGENLNDDKVLNAIHLATEDARLERDLALEKIIDLHAENKDLKKKLESKDLLLSQIQDKFDLLTEVNLKLEMEAQTVPDYIRKYHEERKKLKERSLQKDRVISQLVAQYNEIASRVSETSIPINNMYIDDGYESPV